MQSCCRPIRSARRARYRTWLICQTPCTPPLRTSCARAALRPTSRRTKTWKATGKDNFWKLLQEIDGLLAGKDYVLGKQYSAADGYTLVFYGWGKRIGLPVEQVKKYHALKDRLLQRPAVKKVLEREQSVLLQS